MGNKLLFKGAAGTMILALAACGSARSTQTSQQPGAGKATHSAAASPATTSHQPTPPTNLNDATIPITAPPASPFSAKNWAVVYTGAGVTESQMQGDQLLVFDKDDHPPLSEVPKGTTVLAYISVGEIENFRTDFDFNTLEKKFGIMHPESPSTDPGQSIVANVADPAWYETVLKPRIENAIKQGFNGVMLDTGDTSVANNMAEAFRNVVVLVHDDFPDLKIMVNRALASAPGFPNGVSAALAQQRVINGVLGEQAVGDPSCIAPLQAIEKTGTPVFGLEYVSQQVAVGTTQGNTADITLVIRLDDAERKLNEVPYVSTQALSQLFPKLPQQNRGR